MKLLESVKRIRLAGCDVTESRSDDAAENDTIGDRAWGSPRVTVKASLLPDLEPVVKFRRHSLTIFFGDRVGSIVAANLSKEEINDLASALARRVVRELHDSAMDLANQRRAYAEDRKRRLASKG